jgi:hypothetical protein
MTEKIFKYHVDVRDGANWAPKAQFTCHEYKVLAENERCLVIDDDVFTTLYKAYDKYQTCLNKASISVFRNDNLWGNAIWYTIYSDKPIDPAMIRAEIKAAGAARVEHHPAVEDLSFISDAKEPVQ